MKVAILAVTVGTVFAAQTQAQSLLVDFNSPGGASSDVADLVIGYQFQVNNPITVTGLADFGPTASGNAVGLWDSAGNLLTSATVNSSDPTLGNGFFRYATVPSLTLAPGVYDVGAELDGLNGGLATYTWDVTSLTEISQISAVTPAFGFSSGLAFPDNLGGGADTGYFGGNVVIGTRDRRVPDGGATAILFSLALGGIAMAQRKFRANT